MKIIHLRVLKFSFFAVYSKYIAEDCAIKEMTAVPAAGWEGAVAPVPAGWEGAEPGWESALNNFIFVQG
ncbi:unnamed protein product [Sphagnum balticum]